MSKKKLYQQDYITKAIGQDSVDYIKKAGFKWMVISILIFYSAHFLGVDGNNCGLCGYLSNKVWFIERHANISSFPNAMRAQWLFLFFSAPIFYILLSRNVKKIKHGDMSHRVPVFGLFIIVALVYGVVFGEPEKMSTDTRFLKVIYHNFYGGPLSSFLMFSSFTVCLYLTCVFFKNFIFYLTGKLNGK